MRILIPIFILAFTYMNAYDYSILRQEEFNAGIDELAFLRINVFREYPYFYDGNLEYDKNYLCQYLSTKNSILVIARDKERIIGAISGIPLNKTFSDCRNVFVEQMLQAFIFFF